MIFLLLHRAQASCDRLSRRGSLIAAASSPSAAFFRFFTLLAVAGCGTFSECGDTGDAWCCCCCSISRADEMEECCPTGTSECGGSMCVIANTLLVDGDGEATIRKRTRGARWRLRACGCDNRPLVFAVVVPCLFPVALDLQLILFCRRALMQA